MSDHVQNFYIGNPDPTIHGDKHKLGQDKHGQVHCLVWVYTYPKGEFFAGPDEHALGSSGSGIGRASDLIDARAQLHAYAVQRLNNIEARALDRARRAREALDALGTDPAMLERFTGPYKDSGER